MWKFSLQQKVIFLFSLISLIVIGFIFFNILSNIEISKTSLRIKEEVYKSYKLSVEMSDVLQSIVIKTAEAVEYGSLSSLKIALNDSKNFQEIAKRLLDLNPGEDKVKILETIEATFGEYIKLSKSLTEQLVENKRVESIVTDMVQIRSYVKVLEESISQIKAIGESELYEGINKINMLLNRIRLLSVAVGLLICIICIVIAVGVHWFVVKPIKYISSNITQRMSEFSEGRGDLTEKMLVSSYDEIGDLARTFNFFLEALRQIVDKVKASSESIFDFSREFERSATKLTAGAEEEVSQIDNVTNTTNEVNIMVCTIAEVFKDSTRNMNEMADTLAVMTDSMTEIAQNVEVASNITQSANEKAGATSEMVNNLGVAAQEIDTVIDTITSIADQTNLLALNATIEASRAGAVGKGFAVVANEVKELSKQTAAAINNIREKIEAIQKSTKVTVDDINGISEVIGKINVIVNAVSASVQEQTTSTRELSYNLTSAADSSNRISKDMQQTSNAMESIAFNMKQVNSVVVENTQTATFINDSAIKLEQLSRDLTILVNSFKTER